MLSSVAAAFCEIVELGFASLVFVSCELRLEIFLDEVLEILASLGGIVQHRVSCV